MSSIFCFLAAITAPGLDVDDRPHQGDSSASSENRRLMTDSKHLRYKHALLAIKRKQLSFVFFFPKSDQSCWIWTKSSSNYIPFVKMCFVMPRVWCRDQSVIGWCRSSPWVTQTSVLLPGDSFSTPIRIFWLWMPKSKLCFFFSYEATLLWNDSTTRNPSQTLSSSECQRRGTRDPAELPFNTFVTASFYFY